MKRIGLTGSVALGLALICGSAVADDATTRRRVEELQQQQEKMQRMLDQLRKQVESPQAPAKRVDEVERRQGIMTEELRKLRESIVLPETRELKSMYGFGPAASKVYGIERGLSIGGYGESNLKAVVADKAGKNNNVFDMVRLVLYTGYKFNDWIVLNTELEFEHAVTEDGSDGEVAVEFANLDFFLHPAFNVRAGLVLVPMGFINEMHEPPFYFGNVRPAVETTLLPATWRANGIGLFGELAPGLTYRTYGLTSLDAEDYRSSGLRGARQNGSLERAENFSWVGRLDYAFLPGSLLGGSAYLGDQGQNRKYGDPAIQRKKADVFTQIYEAHLQVRQGGAEFRTLGTMTFVDDVTVLSQDPDINQPIGNRMYGVYAELGYDILPLLLPDTTHYLAPWVRYSRTDTQNNVASGFKANKNQVRDYYEVGLQYKPIPQVVLKLDYRNVHAESGKLPDEIRIGGGFVF